jgi:hypothetical protein
MQNLKIYSRRNLPNVKEIIFLIFSEITSKEVAVHLGYWSDQSGY